MHVHASFLSRPRALAVSLILWAAGLPSLGAEVTLTRTNSFDRWITNVIEISMPVNRFVNDYHTNWVTLLRTNTHEVYRTNRVTVQATSTNIVTAYQTNWTSRTETNLLTVNAVRTNLVDQLQTNWSILNLTNWETVVLFHTNRVTQPLTNIVQVDLPERPAAPAAAAPRDSAEPKDARPEPAPPTVAPTWNGPLSLEASRTDHAPANNLVEVLMKVRLTGDAGAAPQVQRWRVEREDGAILCFGQDQDFKRQLPAGKYKVEAKLKAEGDDLPRTVRGTLSLTAREAVIQQKLLVKK